jgi:chemotaxis protein MotA
MDLGIIFGLVGTWVLIIWALLMGGKIGMYLDVSSMVLVGGTTVTVVFLAFPIRNVKILFAVLRKAVFWKSGAIEQLIDDLVSYAEIARRGGILSLENTTKDIDDPFIVQGIQMAVDGTEPELIEAIMTSDLESQIERHEIGKGLLQAIGKYSPAFGMIGTLVGLVAMLADLSDPSSIGAGLAVALLTTMYGAIIANACALPLADRLGRRSGEEVLYKTIIIKGVMAIQSGDNPRIVEQKLRTFLPPSMRPANEKQEAA